MPLSTLWETRFSLAEELFRLYGPEGLNTIEPMYLSALQIYRRTCFALIGELVCTPLSQRVQLLHSERFQREANQAVDGYKQLLQLAMQTPPQHSQSAYSR